MRSAASLAIICASGCAAATATATAAPTSTTDLSPCAVACMQVALPVVGCEATNTTCLCTSPTYITSVGLCLKQNCSVKESLVAQRIQQDTCGAPIRNKSDFTRRTVWVLVAVAAFSVVSRIVFRAPVLKGSGLGIDDYTILAAFLLTIPLSVIVNNITHAGLGQDIWQLPFDNITEILHYFWVAEFLYVWVMSMTKLSMVVLYLRIWVTARQEQRDWFRISCFSMIVFLITFAVMMSVTLGFECNPISYAWLRWDNEHSGSCIDLKAQVFAMAGVNIAQDVMVCFLPLPKLFAMSLPLKKKLVVICIFLVGSFVMICSAIRLQYLVQWGTTDNPTWYYNSIALWSGVECTVAIICACLPAMAGLVQRVYRLSVGIEHNTSYGSSASRHTKRRSSHPQRWHELNSPNYNVPTERTDSEGDIPSKKFSEPQAQPVSGWD